MNNRYLKSQRISLEKNTQLDKSWVKQKIADDPSILELGDLVVRDIDRTNTHAGWPDLLLQDSEKARRYVVHLQLGASDETQIIRAIESYDAQEQSLPQYEYRAVLVAEDIASRHLNVISLINGTVPFIAIQMQTFQVGEYITLLFSKVTGKRLRSSVDADEDAETTPADPAYWETHASKETVALVDQMLELVHDIDPTLNLKYNTSFIGLERDGQPVNFVKFIPCKSQLGFEIRLPLTDELSTKVDTAGLSTLEHGRKASYCRLRLTSRDIKSRADVLRELSKLAYERNAGI